MSLENAQGNQTLMGGESEQTGRLAIQEDPEIWGNFEEMGSFSPKNTPSQTTRTGPVKRKAGTPTSESEEQAGTKKSRFGSVESSS